VGKLSRTKGADFERDIAVELRVLYPSARRGAQMQARLGLKAAAEEKFADVEGTPWWVECKHGKSISIHGALAQGTAATDGRAVIAITRIDRHAAVASMYLQDFMHLLRDVEDARKLRLAIDELREAAARELEAERKKHQTALVEAVEDALRNATDRH